VKWLTEIHRNLSYVLTLFHLSNLQCPVQNGSGAHFASYPMGTWCSVPGRKVAGV